MLETCLPLKTPPMAWDYLDDFRTSDNADEFLLHYSSKLIEHYGDIIALSPNLYLITSPSAFKHVLKTHYAHYSKQHPTYKRYKYIFGESLIVTEGPLWKQHRQILQQAFNQSQFSQYASIMVQETKQHIQHWQHQGTASINLLSEMKHLSLKIAFKTFCNYELTMSDSTMLRASVLTGLKNLSNTPFLSPWYPNGTNLHFFWSIRKINILLKKIIQKRRLEIQSPIQQDLLSLLLSESLFDDQAILDELKTMILTGHETTACALTWSIYLLNQHPEYRLQMEMEVDQVLGNRTATLEDCQALPLVKAIFQETLRLYPTIWCLFRTSTQEDVIDGYKIPAHSRCLLNIHALHRNPHYWDKPNDFYPERFLHATENKHLDAFMPFSTGPHTCIGSHFAMTEGILLLATFAQHVRFNPMYEENQLVPTPYFALQPPSLKVKVVEK